MYLELGLLGHVLTPPFCRYLKVTNAKAANILAPSPAATQYDVMLSAFGPHKWL